MNYYWKLIREIISLWNSDNISRLSASLAYYAIFSITPLLIICITVVGFILGNEEVKSQILAQISTLTGSTNTSEFEYIIKSPSIINPNIFNTIIGIIIFLFGLMGFFWELQGSINEIWRVQPKPGLSIWYIIKKRLLSFTLVLGIVFLLLASLIINIIITAAKNYFMIFFSKTEFFWSLINFIISYLIISFLFATIFKILPDIILKWKDVVAGSLMTAFLFSIGKVVLQFYLGNSHISTAYGAAGSLIVILVWVYYSSQILFIGVEFIKVNAKLKGKKIIPTHYAEFIKN